MPSKYKSVRVNMDIDVAKWFEDNEEYNLSAVIRRCTRIYMNQHNYSLNDIEEDSVSNTKHEITKENLTPEQIAKNKVENGWPWKR